MLAAQRMCTATDVLKILRAAGSTANVHSGGKCEAVFSAEKFLNRQFQDGIFLISIPAKYAFLVTFIPDRQIQKQPVETSCLSSLTNCLSPLTNWPKLTEIGRNWPKLAEIGRNWLKLVEIARNWLKLMKIARNWQKLVENCREVVKSEERW